MCPLWPLHIIFLYLLLLWPLCYVSCELAKRWTISTNPTSLTQLSQYQPVEVNFALESPEDYQFEVQFDDPLIASVDQKDIYIRRENDTIHGSFNLTTNYFGYSSAKICGFKTRPGVELKPTPKCDIESEPLKIAVKREKTTLDRVFTGTVIVLVSIIFINFGCTLDKERLRDAFVRPVGPFIGLLSHFLILPLVSYGLGLLLFPTSPMLRLGLFFSGIAPAGGASNIWTFSLGGNLDLSITMTAISTLASFVMIPTWVFTLGRTIFTDNEMSLPYQNLLTSGLSPFISLTIGYLIQIYMKSVANVMVRILKPFSALLIIFIVVFASITNFYLFKLFSWQIIAGGLLLPWTGYLAGWILSTISSESPENRLAITIETGVQNTGISIFLLRTCLPQPDSDITTIVPVSVALLTPLPLIMVAIWKRFCSKKDLAAEKLDDGDVFLNEKAC